MGWLLGPDDIFQLGLPVEILFGDAQRGMRGLEPGALSAITHTGTGTGKVTATGIARGMLAVVLRCESGGETNVSEQANPGALPIFSVSSNGGATFGAARAITDARNVAHLDNAATGLRFSFENGPTVPSFVALDTYALSTQPSPNLLSLMEAAESEVLEAACGSYDPPITGAPPHWKQHAVRLWRWAILELMGVSKKRDMQSYRPTKTWDWLETVRDGRATSKFQAQGVRESKETSFPLFVPPLPDPNIPPI